jgi:hypothetical protein
MEKENIVIQHGENNAEFLIPGTIYKADGYCKETNTIYEFLGDYWHGNIEKYSRDFINKNIKKSMGELYDKTMDRINEIINLGYNVKFIWENDFKKLIIENNLKFNSNNELIFEIEELKESEIDNTLIIDETD